MTRRDRERCLFEALWSKVKSQWSKVNLGGAFEQRFPPSGSRNVPLDHDTLFGCIGKQEFLPSSES
eukprot:2208081-Rhodomonas_salina.2